MNRINNMVYRNSVINKIEADYFDLSYSIKGLNFEIGKIKKLSQKEKEAIIRDLAGVIFLFNWDNRVLTGVALETNKKQILKAKKLKNRIENL